MAKNLVRRPIADMSATFVPLHKQYFNPKSIVWSAYRSSGRIKLLLSKSFVSHHQSLFHSAVMASDSAAARETEPPKVFQLGFGWFALRARCFHAAAAVSFLANNVVYRCICRPDIPRGALDPTGRPRTRKGVLAQDLTMRFVCSSQRKHLLTPLLMINRIFCYPGVVISG